MGRPRTILDSEILAHAKAVFLEQGASGSTKAIARRGSDPRMTRRSRKSISASCSPYRASK